MSEGGEEGRQEASKVTLTNTEAGRADDRGGQMYASVCECKS